MPNNILRGVAALAPLVVLLAACGDRSSDPPPPTPASTAPAPSAETSTAAVVAPSTASAAPSTSAPATTAEKKLLVRYDEIRRALAGDSIAGLSESARALAGEAKAIDPALASAATALAAAVDLSKARESFGALSDAAIALRRKSKSTEFGIFYCPMANRSWLQGDRAKVANPFYGSQMLECGWEVDENGKEIPKG